MRGGENSLSDKPMISVIVPIYNVERYVEKCLDSVLSQDFSDFEVVLVDDGSTDKSSAICQDYAFRNSKIKYFRKENGGLSSARNYGLDVSAGQYITFIDSDDYLDSRYLSHLHRLVDNHHADIATCFYCIERNGSANPWRPTDEEEIPLGSRDALLCLFQSKEIDVCAVCKLFKRDLFDGIVFPEGKLFEDVGTTYKLIGAAKIVAVSHKSLYHYVMRDDSIVHKADKRVFHRSELAKQAVTDVKKMYPDDRELINAAERYAATHSLSTLRMVDLSDAEQRDEARVMRKELLKQRRQITGGKHASTLDKIALNILPLGLGAYQLAWRAYSKIRGR